MNGAFRLINSNMHCSCTRITVQETLCTVYTLFTGPQPLYSEKNIKNRSYGTIYTFKNYFDAVFSVFSF